jgi:hypothetical protein
MQFLLMSKEKIAASKATRAVWTLEWFLFCVRALMALQMFESCKGATAGTVAALAGISFFELSLGTIVC